MNKRKLIIIGIALVILVLGKLAKDSLAKPEERGPQKPKLAVATVFAKTVKNDSMPVFIQSTGVLEAVRRIELFSEVQGLMMADDGRFKAGNSFKKGDLLLAIRSNDQQAQLYSQRSAFESLLVSLMPDLKADYPEDFDIWERYLAAFSTASQVADLPNSDSKKINSFLVGRGVYSEFHKLKNMEIIQAKYSIRAPYDGMLISVNVDPGTVIRPGQALGVFIQPDVYELETSADALTAERLKEGQKVELSLEGLHNKVWSGRISRIVKAIDKNSQLSTFFVAVNAGDLKEGMFLQAKIKANEIPNAIELSRSALVGNNQVYIVKNGALLLKEIKKEFVSRDFAIISGLSDGELVLTKVPPAAFEGMKVEIYQEG